MPAEPIAALMQAALKNDEARWFVALNPYIKSGGFLEIVMVRLLLFAVAAAISVGVGLGAAYYCFLLLWHPEQILVQRRETKSQEYFRYALGGAAFFALGYMTYRGVEGMLWWLPRSWTVTDEDGEREWVGHSIALTIAFGGSGLFLTKLYELLEELMRARNDLSRDSLDVNKRPRLTPPSLGRSIAWLADRRRDPTPINKRLDKMRGRKPKNALFC